MPITLTLNTVRCKRAIIKPFGARAICLFNKQAHGISNYKYLVNK